MSTYSNWENSLRWTSISSRVNDIPSHLMLHKPGRPMVNRFARAQRHLNTFYSRSWPWFDGESNREKASVLAAILLPDIGSPLQRCMWSHSNPYGDVFSAAGGCQFGSESGGQYRTITNEKNSVSSFRCSLFQAEMVTINSTRIYFFFPKILHHHEELFL
jgi:hypothetical protein